MKYCRNCGNGMDDNAIFCPKCGARANGDGPAINFDTFGGGYTPYGAYQPVDTAPSALVAVAAFSFWWAGLALWYFCRYTRPGKAKSALKGALSSACVSMPFIGAILWALWKNDPTKQEYAKVGAISALAGAAFYALVAILSIVLTLTGVVDAGYYVPLFV